MTLTFKLQRLALDATYICHHTATDFKVIDIKVANELITEAPEDSEVFKVRGCDTVIKIGTNEYVRYAV